MDICVCREALQHSFATVREAVYGAQDRDVLLANSELLAQSAEKWMGCQIELQKRAVG